MIVFLIPISNKRFNGSKQNQTAKQKKVNLKECSEERMGRKVGKSWLTVFSHRTLYSSRLHVC